MNREKQLIKNTAIVAFGQICTKFISFFLLPLYTYLLSAKEYGIVDLINTYVSLLLPIFFFQIDQAIFRFLIDVRDNEYKKKQLISSSFFTIVIQSVIFSILFIIISLFIKNEYKFFLLINVITLSFSNYVLQVSRGLGDNSTYSIGSLISGVGTITLNILFIAVFKWQAYGMLFATCISNILCFLYVVIKKTLFKYISLRDYNKKNRIELWKYSIPLIPNQLSWWIIHASDRTIISIFLSVAENGVYSAANKFSGILINIFSVFNITWSESASMHIHDKDNSEYFSKVMNSALKIVMTTCLIVIAIMPLVFKYLIIGEEYKTAYNQIPILLVSTIFNIAVSLFGSIYVGLKKSKEISKTSIYAALINIIVNITLIKFVGLYAASISTLISFFAMTIYRYIDIQKYVKIKIDKKIIITFLIMCLFILPTYYYKKVYLCLLCFIITIIISIFINKKELDSCFNYIKNKFKAIIKIGKKK